MKRGGIAGTILKVDLTAGTVSKMNTPQELLGEYLGGRGLGAYLLSREVPPAADPLGPDNRLIFMNGPLACSLIPANNKVCVTFKSPLTGSYSYSLCGGHWGPELRFAGSDGLIIGGRAPEPLYLWIDDGAVELRPAGNLWGKTIPECEELIRDELGGDEGIQIAAIGPAGEKGNLMACITAGWYREFGRGGCGAVMGSKNLKAIAVRGTQDISFADAAGMKDLSERLCVSLRELPKIIARRQYGTAEMVEGINNLGMWATRNFTEGFFEEGYKLEGPRMRSDIVVGDSSCYGCPVGCGKRSAVQVGDRKILMEGPEFETIGLIGANCGISDWETILRATEICDVNGMDTMNAGGCVALAMECFERGIISLKETGGIDLRFGNGEALVQVLQLMVEGKGIGAILAKGVQSAGEQFGAPELAMHSKGQGLAVYDPRGCKGMALTYATSPKGAHHMIATTMAAEIPNGTRLSAEGKGQLQRDQQFSMCVVDSIALCSTVRGGVSLKHQAEAYTAVTGIEMDEERLYLAAERIINLERMYNVRLGFSRKDDTLPKRFLEEALKTGESAGETVDLDPMLDDFYAVMGWDRNGIPTEEKLARLGLSDLLK